MSTDAAPSAINVYSALLSTPDWASFEEACEHNSDMKSWSNDAKTLAEKALKSHEGGEGLSIHSLKPWTEYALHSNKAIVSGLSAFKERKEEGALKEAHGKMVDALGDQYINMSSHMMDFLSEMEGFLMLAHNSHDYVAHVIQQYLETETDKRDAEHYKKIVEKLEELKRSDNVFEHSAEGLLLKAEGLINQHKEMLQKLQEEINNLELAEQRESDQKSKSWTWKHITAMIGTSLAIGLIIAVVAVTIVCAPPTALAFSAIALPVAAGAAAVAVYLWNEVDKVSTNHPLDVDKSRSNDTRHVIRELGDIKSSIDSVINVLKSLLYKPDSGMDLKYKEDIDFTMKSIEDKLKKFLNTINKLEENVETCKEDVLKARKEVYA